MENFQGNYSRATKIKVPPGMETKKLVIGGGRYHSSCLSPKSFGSENVDPNSPILRYLRGGSPRGLRSPLSMVENLIERSPPPRSPPAMYRTPVKAVEGEEVFVMDAVPVRRSSRFSGSESSGSSAKSPFKAEMFLSPEDSGKRGYSSKCQFDRGEEDDRPTRLGIKNRTELQFIARSPNNLFSPGRKIPPDETMPICNNYPRISSNDQLASLNQKTLKTRASAPAPAPVPRVAPIPNDAPVIPSFPISYKDVVKVNEDVVKVNKDVVKGNETFKDWSPLDDGIESSLPGSSSSKPPSREVVDKYIEMRLAGTKKKKRFDGFPELE